MRALVTLALAAVAVAVPAGLADAHAGYRPKHAHKRHYRDEQVRMPKRHRPPVKPPVVQPPAPKPLARVQVTAREFSFTLSRQQLTPGAVTVELDNRGQDPHNLRVQRAEDPLAGFDFALTKPGSFSTRKLVLGPGTWKLYCTLEGHAALGMSATVTVTG